MLAGFKPALDVLFITSARSFHGHEGQWIPRPAGDPYGIMIRPKKHRLRLQNKLMFWKSGSGGGFHVNPVPIQTAWVDSENGGTTPEGVMAIQVLVKEPFTSSYDCHLRCTDE
jgi:hypothetical protein